MRTLIYDCEIDSDPTVLGWRNFEALNLTVIGTWRNWPMPVYRAYRCDRPEDFARFQAIANTAEETVGFNSHSFDDPLCQAHGISIATNIDLLEEVRELAGMPRTYVRGITRAGYSPNRLAIANLGKNKTGTGADVPKLWQAGRRAEVVEYCLRDIKLTKSLYERWREGVLIDPTTGKGLGNCRVESVLPGWETAIARLCGLRPIPEGSSFSGWYGQNRSVEHFNFVRQR